MKTFLIPAALLAAILSLSLWAGSYTCQATQGYLQDIKQASHCAQREQWDDALFALQKSWDHWQKNRAFFHTIAQHSDLDEVDILFTGTFAAAGRRDPVEFAILISQLETRLKLLAESQTMSLQNIF